MRTTSMPTRLTRDQRKAQTRERLLATAKDVLLRRGFHAATLDEIALEAGLTKGAVYSNFASKAHLFLAVVDARVREQAPTRSQDAVHATSLEDLARRHARAAIADDPDGRWASVLIEAWAAADDDEPFRAALLERNRAVNSQIAGHIEEVAARSGMEFPYPVETLAQSCGGMLRGLLLQRLLDQARVPSEVIEDAFVAFVRGMARPRPHHQPTGA
jgi:AcrR family transcriptional regulator